MKRRRPYYGEERWMSRKNNIHLWLYLPEMVDTISYFNGWVRKAVIVYESFTGDKVLKGEYVKFIDGDSSNFDPTNLILHGRTQRVVRCKQCGAPIIRKTKVLKRHGCSGCNNCKNKVASAARQAVQMDVKFCKRPGHRKLTRNQVDSLWEMSLQGHSTKNIAKSLSVSPTTVKKVIAGEHYREVPPPRSFAKRRRLSVKLKMKLQGIEKRTRIAVDCLQCGKRTHFTPARYKRTVHKFCSVRCYREWRSSHSVATTPRKLKTSTIIKLRSLRKNGSTLKQLAEMFGISQSSVCNYLKYPITGETK